MKKLKEKSLIILFIILILSFTTSVCATDSLIDVTSNSAGKTNASATQPVQTITQVDEPTFSSVNQTVYANKNTSVRESYNSSAKVLQTLSKGQSITRTGVASSIGWSKVETSDGKVGYVLTADLDTTAPSTTPIENTNTSSLYTNNTNNTNNTNTTLPQTGIGDSTGMYIIIGICIVSAIYAYRKIREYNI